MLINSKVSDVSDNDQNDEDDFFEEELKPIPRSQIMKYYKPKWLIGVGIISSMISSIQLPVFGFLLSKMVFLMQNF